MGRSRLHKRSVVASVDPRGTDQLPGLGRRVVPGPAGPRRGGGGSGGHGELVEIRRERPTGPQLGARGSSSLDGMHAVALGT